MKNLTHKTTIYYCIIGAAIAVLWVIVFGAHRPYIGISPIKLAKYLVENNRPAKECYDFIIIDPINSPSYIERKHSCIYDYAKLKKDPTACELLMPSDYGWSCLGVIESELSKGFGCGSTDTNINCGSYNIYTENRGIEDCNIYSEQVLQDWCHAQRSKTMVGINECNRIVTDTDRWSEECQMYYAFKERDASACNTITAGDRKQYCLFYIQMMKKYL